MPLAAEAAGNASKEQYRQDFAAQRGPTGEPWAPTLAGGHPILVDSGALAQSTVSISGAKVELDVGEYYGRFHQGGWKTGQEKVKVGTGKFRETVTYDKHGEETIRIRESKRTVRVGGRA